MFLLAGTYWRIWGHQQNAAHCYRQALARVPRQFRDVVLVNFGGLLYKTGNVDDALFMVRDALAVDNKQPETNFLAGGMYNVKVCSADEGQLACWRILSFTSACRVI